MKAKVRLVPVSPERRAEFVAMIDEWKADDPSQAYGSIHAIALSDVDGYFKMVEGLRDGRGPLRGTVPTGTFWIEENGALAGTVNLRYELEPRLLLCGGNIGYSVRPLARGRGVAQRGLRLALDILHGRGTPEALLTCNDDNAASAHIIEKAGGRRIEDTILDDGTLERRYWVPTAPNDNRRSL